MINWVSSNTLPIVSACLEDEAGEIITMSQLFFIGLSHPGSEKSGVRGWTTLPVSAPASSGLLGCLLLPLQLKLPAVMFLPSSLSSRAERDRRHPMKEQHGA